MVKIPYPFNRGQKGLFAGKRTRSGHQVSFSEKKTNRWFKPNVQTKTFLSEYIGEIKIKVTTYALRWIEKMGGIDNYLLWTHPKKIDSEKGMELRAKIIANWEKKENRTFNRRQLLWEMRQKSIQEGVKGILPTTPIIKKLKAASLVQQSKPAGNLADIFGAQTIARATNITEFIKLALQERFAASQLSQQQSTQQSTQSPSQSQSSPVPNTPVSGSTSEARN